MCFNISRGDIAFYSDWARRFSYEVPQTMQVLSRKCFEKGSWSNVMRNLFTKFQVFYALLFVFQQIEAYYKFRQHYADYCTDLLPSNIRSPFQHSIISILAPRDQHGRRIILVESGGWFYFWLTWYLLLRFPNPLFPYHSLSLVAY